MAATHVAAGAAIALTVLGLYGGALSSGFHFDDEVNILGNPFLRMRELGLEGLSRATAGGANRRPVANLSFALSHYAAGGYRVESFRAVNLVLHAANGLLVYALALVCLRAVAKLPGQRGPRPTPRGAALLAGFSALLFVAHPLQTQSVTYVVQRMNLLATGFHLLALLLYAAGRARPRGRERGALWLGSAGCWLLALGSKEIAIALPVAIWLFEWCFVRDLERGFARRSLLRGGLPLLLLAAALFYAYFQGPDWGYAKRDFGMAERSLTQLRVVVFYLGLFALPWPARQSVHHPFEPSQGLFDPTTTALSAGLLLVLLAAAAAALPRARLLGFGALWFFLHHLLESSILPLEMAYEHRNYLPLVGPCLAAPPALWALGRHLGLGARPLAAAGVLAICALGTATVVRNRVWHDGETLWSDVLARYPGEARALNNLGVALAARGDLAGAARRYRAALEADPESAAAHRNLGLNLLRRGELEPAQAHLERALRHKPRDATSEAGLADVHRVRGRLEEAARHYQRSLAIYPDEQAFAGLARVRLTQGRSDEALHLFELSLRLQPGYVPAHLGRSALLAARGELEPAAAAWADAVEALRAAGPGDHRPQLAAALWGVLEPLLASPVAPGGPERVRRIGAWAEGIARAAGNEPLARHIGAREP